MAAVVEMSGDQAKLEAAFLKLENRVRQLEGGLTKVGRAGQRSGKQTADSFDQGTKALNSMMLRLAGPAGALAAFARLGQYMETSATNLREISAEANKAARELVSLASLQQSGARRGAVLAASDLATAYGVTDRGAAFNTIQAMQSLRGSFAAGLTTSEAIFQATRLGIPIDAATELEVAGAQFQQAPGELLQKVYAAGKLSARDPATLARIAPALQAFPDTDTALAVATGISGAFSGEQLQAYLRGTGIALSSVSAEEFQETLAGLGVATGSYMEKLKALADAGLDTVEELGEAGLTEQRQAFGLAAAIKAYGNIARFREQIAATPTDLIASELGDIETDFPMVKNARQIAVLRSAYADEMAFGTAGERAQLQEIEDRKFALNLLRQGKTELGPFNPAGLIGGYDVLTPEGDLTIQGRRAKALRDVLQTDVFNLDPAEEARSRQSTYNLLQDSDARVQPRQGQPDRLITTLERLDQTLAALINKGTGALRMYTSPDPLNGLSLSLARMVP